MSVNTQPPNKEEQEKLELLRRILFHEEKQQIERLDTILEKKEPLAERVMPIIEEELEKFERHFPKTYQLAVDRLVERKLQQSQGQLLDLLYPMMGKMIRKYIAQQLQELRESVEQQVRRSFFGRLRERLTGVRESDRIISLASQSRVQEAYVIEQHSGLLMGSASSQSMVDKELIAGMLTAIKSFAVDAFQRGDTQLETITYAGYQILIHDFSTYYVALAIQGTLTAKEQEELTDRILEFADRELSRRIGTKDAILHAHIGKALQNYFMKNPEP